MPSTIEYALMAGSAYYSTRDDINRIPRPDGWEQLPGFNRRQDDTCGFEAAAFVKGGEIVISFAGTYDKSLADKAADVAHWQILQAAAYYEGIKGAPPGASISG